MSRRDTISSIIPNLQHAVGYRLLSTGLRAMKFGNATIVANTHFPDLISPDYANPEIIFTSGNASQRAMAAEASSWVMACIRFRIAEIKNVNWEVCTPDGEPILNNALRNTVLYALQMYDQDLLERWMTMKLVHGTAYMAKLPQPETGGPGGLYVLNSIAVAPHVINGRLTHYEYSAGSNVQRIALDEVFVNRFQNLLSDIRGDSPMDRALHEVNIDSANKATILKYLLGDGKPGILLTLHPNVPIPRKAERDRLRNEWKESGSGKGGGYDSRMITGPYNVTPYNTNKPDSVLSEDARITICREFGIDAALLGATSVADPLGNNTTMAEKRGLMLRYTIKPDLIDMADFINAQILPWLMPGQDVNFKWDYTEIDALLNHSNETVREYRADFMTTISSYHETRKRRDLKDMSDEVEDWVFMPQNLVPVRVSKLQEYIEAKELANGVGVPDEMIVQMAAQRLMGPPGQQQLEGGGGSNQSPQEENNSTRPTTGAGQSSDAQKVLDELEKWERVTVNNHKRALGFVAHDIDPATAEGIRFQLEIHELDHKPTVRALFQQIREVMSNEYGAMKQDRLFDPILYADRLVTIHQSDLDDAVRETDDELMRDVLNARADPNSVELQGQPVDELEGGQQ